MLVQVTLPLKPEHIPLDKKLPDAMGVPVRANYSPDAQIGTVTKWEDNGDGTALATLDIEEEFFYTDVTYGLDAHIKSSFEDGKHIVHSMVKIKAIGVWSSGYRTDSDYELISMEASE